MVIPKVAPIFGREKIKENRIIIAHSFYTQLLNRNYVKPQLNAVLQNIAKGLDKKLKGIKLVYLDANFPFFNGFPLFPHRSHSDGKKIDLAFIYTDKNYKLTNKKPATSGYGVFEKPLSKERNQTVICKKQKHWQYDFTKYLSFGCNKDLVFSKKATKILLKEILKENKIQKVFIEPHLKTRLNLKHSKIRFQGCKAVRHDDHIHIQIY